MLWGSAAGISGGGGGGGREEGRREAQQLLPSAFICARKLTPLQRMSSLPWASTPWQTKWCRAVVPQPQSFIGLNHDKVPVFTSRGTGMSSALPASSDSVCFRVPFSGQTARTHTRARTHHTRTPHTHTCIPNLSLLSLPRLLLWLFWRSRICWSVKLDRDDS